MTPMIQDPPIQDPSGGRRARRRRLQRWIVICGLLVAVLGLASTFWLRAGAPPDTTVAQPSPSPAATTDDAGEDIAPGAGPPQTGSADLASESPRAEAPATEASAAPPAPAPAQAPAPAPAPAETASIETYDWMAQADTYASAGDGQEATASTGGASSKPLPDRTAAGWCAGLGVLVDSVEECQSYESIIERLQLGGLAYNKPDSAYLGHVEEVTLAVDLRGAEQAAEIVATRPGEVVQAAVPVTRIMSAELRGPSFEISPSGPLQKTLSGAAPVVWTWKATPQEAGANKLLLLDVYVHVTRGGDVGEPITIRTYRDEITVDVRLKDQIVGALTSTQGIVVSAVAILGGLSTIFGWKRWQKREKGD